MVETYNEPSLRIKYRSQGVQTLFYESNPSTSTPLGDQISPGLRRNFRHAGTNHPHAPKEGDNRGASELPRILLKHIPGTKSFRRVAQLINTLDLVGFILNRKKSELDLTQDLQFLGIRLRLDLGEASLPESKAWEIVAHARHLSSLHVLTYSQVSQVMGSLDRLGLRSYPSGSFVPDTPSTLFSLIRSDRRHRVDQIHWSLPTFYGTGRTYVFLPRESPSAHFRRISIKLLLWLEAQNILVARHIPGCLNVIADQLSRPNRPISTEWSLHPEIVKRIFGLWGTPEVDRVELPPSCLQFRSHER